MPILEALAEAPEVVVLAVVSSPARPADRGGRGRPTPAAARAVERGLALLTPERLRDPATVAALAALEPGLIVLADYGRLVPQAVLDLPARGALNLHPSLLPRWRGASPIPAAILAGDGITGVSLMLMDVGLDSGPLVATRPVALQGDEAAPDLEARLAGEAADLLRASLGPWLRGELQPRPQATTGVTLTRPLRRMDGRLDPSRPAAELERQVRAYRPWPGTYLELDGERLIVLEAAVDGPPGEPVGEAGRVVADGDGLALQTGAGRLRLLRVRPAGRRAMSGAEARRGRPHLVGSSVADPKRPPTLA